MIVILDYGMGNLRSIQNKIERLDENVIISSNWKTSSAPTASSSLVSAHSMPPWATCGGWA